MSEITQSFSLILSSDGSGNPLHSGGAAAIVEAREPLLKLKLAAYLGPATGNEAEIMAGVLGFAAIAALSKASFGERRFGRDVLWQTDSQYVIRTVNELKAGRELNASLSNHGLWRALSLCSSALTLYPKHVRARSGERRNHACDHASKWIQRSGTKLLARHGEARIGRMKDSAPAEAWHLLDLKLLLDTARGADDGAISEGAKGLISRLESRVGQFL